MEAFAVSGIKNKDVFWLQFCTEIDKLKRLLKVKLHEQFPPAANADKDKGKLLLSARLLPVGKTQPPHIAVLSDNLITKLKSLRIKNLNFSAYQYPGKGLYKTGYHTERSQS